MFNSKNDLDVATNGTDTVDCTSTSVRNTSTEGLDDDSCHRIDLPVEEESPKSAAQTPVNETGELHLHVESTDVGVEEPKLFITEVTEKDRSQPNTTSSGWEQKNEDNTALRIEEGNKVPGAFRSDDHPPAPQEVETSSSPIISFAANHDDQKQPAVIVDEVKETEEKEKIINSRNASNKVIIPAIVLRIDEDEEVAEEVVGSDHGVAVGDAPTEEEEEDIKPVGAAASDRGGGLRRWSGGVEGGCEIAICTNDDYNNNQLIKDDQLSERLLINQIATSADVHPQPSTAPESPTTTAITDEDNQAAVSLAVTAGGDHKEPPTKESTSSHQESTSEGNEAKVITPQGEREENSTVEVLVETKEEALPFAEVVVCDNDRKARHSADGKELTAITADSDGSASAENKVVDGTNTAGVGRESGSVGVVVHDGGERNTNVQIRRKQYGVISSLDDYITATSSSSMDTLDTLSSVRDYDEPTSGGGVGGMTTTSVESGSERISMSSTMDSRVSEDGEDRTEFWIHALLEDKQRRSGSDMVSEGIIGDGYQAFNNIIMLNR